MKKPTEGFDKIAESFQTLKKDFMNILEPKADKAAQEKSFQEFYKKFIELKPQFGSAPEIVLNPENFKKAMRYAFISGNNAK